MASFLAFLVDNDEFTLNGDTTLTTVSAASFGGFTETPVVAQPAVTAAAASATTSRFVEEPVVARPVVNTDTANNGGALTTSVPTES